MDTTTLTRPDWLRPLADRESAVAQQAISINSEWWRAKLARTPFGGEAPPAREALSRADLFDIGADASNSASAARRLLWATLSWGTGRRHRLNRKRITSVVEHQDRGAFLCDAARLARTDPAAAYTSMRPESGNVLAYLGPAFFTKYLYFAGAGNPDHPCLILDSLVADALQRECGWTSLRGRRSWPAETYVRYCRLLRRWAQDLSTSERPVAPDELERSLFQRGRERRGAQLSVTTGDGERIYSPLSARH